MTTTCPSCDRVVDVDGSAWGRCERCRVMVFPANGGPDVVVAHESDRIAARVSVVLSEVGIHPLHAANGGWVLRLIEKQRPRAAVLDVGLAGIMSFQILEYLRSRPDLTPLKVVLVASVYNRTAYKRRPISLYGADDYVEQHHVHDLLPEKLCALLQLPTPPALDRTQRIDEQDTRKDLTGPERVRALARSIAADVALYHPVETQQAVRGKPPIAIERALVEGGRLLAEMIAPGRPDGDPVADAFGAIVAELRGGRG